MADSLVVKKPKRSKYWADYIKGRISKNKNFLGMISGATGTGKSWSALSIAEQLDSEFDVSRCVFRGKELMRLINSDKLKSGSVVIWDEVGVDLSNRSWQSTTNKLLNYLLQTFRHRNIILLFTAPYSDFVDALTRRLFHAEFKTESINYEKQTTKLKPQLIQYNSRIKKFYFKYLRLVTKEYGVVPITAWHVPAPSKELIQAYEAKKAQFTKELNREIESALDNLEGKETETQITSTKPLTELQELIMECWKSGITKQIDIGAKLNKDQSQIARNEKWMCSKGYNKAKIGRM